MLYFELGNDIHCTTCTLIMAANPAVKVSTAACGQVMLHGLMAAWHTIMSINVSGCIKYFAEVPIACLHIFMKPLYPPILSNDMQYGDFHKQLLMQNL